MGGLIAWLLIPFAYSQRGYSAIGGEWLAVFIVSFAAFQISKWLWHKIAIVLAVTLKKQ